MIKPTLRSGWCYLCLQKTAVANAEHGRREPSHADRDELGSGQRAAEHESTVRVAPKELQPEPGNRVQQRVRDDDIAVLVPPAPEPQQDNEQYETHRRFVQLHRMERHAE